MLAVSPGCQIAYNQPDWVYRKAEGVSQSELKEVLRSPAHWLARYGPDAVPTFPSIAMIIGTALHCKVLEPQLFNSLFVDRSQKEKELTVTELKEALDAEGIEYKKTAKKPELVSLLYPDGQPVDKRTTLAPDDFRMVCGMADALRTHSVTGKWFEPGAANYTKANELSMYVEAAANPYGMPMKGRLDRLIKSSGGFVILDLKSTDDASPDAFMKKAFNLSYHLQAAYYTELVRRTLGVENVRFIFCAVERRAPHGIGLYEASEDFASYGAEKMAEGFKALRYAKESGIYSGYSDHIESLGLPAWAKKSSGVLF